MLGGEGNGRELEMTGLGERGVGGVVPAIISHLYYSGIDYNIVKLVWWS